MVLLVDNWFIILLSNVLCCLFKIPHNVSFCRETGTSVLDIWCVPWFKVKMDALPCLLHC